MGGDDTMYAQYLQKQANYFEKLCCFFIYIHTPRTYTYDTCRFRFPILKRLRHFIAISNLALILHVLGTSP
jgi:hypothetical protein